MQIREMDKGDVPDVSALARKTFTETFGHSFTPEELAHQLETTRSETYFLSAMLADTFLVAVFSNRIAGYIQLTDANRYSTGRKHQAVNALYIHSDFQGKGIGRALMDAAFQHSRFQQAEAIYIDVWDQNKRAMDFYLNYGFEQSGTCDVIVDGVCIGRDLVLKMPGPKTTYKK